MIRRLLMIAVAALLLGCGDAGPAKLLCSLEGEAYFVEREAYRWVVRRVPSGDRLCPKGNAP